MITMIRLAALLGLSVMLSAPGVAAAQEHPHQPPAQAHGQDRARAIIGGIAVAEPWARATVQSAPAGAVFVTLTNTGNTPDRLVSAASDAAAKVELHTHINDNGIMRMRAVDAIALAPGETTMLRPGGNHIMLMGLKAPLVQGRSFPLTLTFEKAGSITIQVPIKDAGAMGHGS